MMKPILLTAMAGLLLVLILTACEERVSSPPASQSESNPVRENDDAGKEFILLEALRQAEALEQPDSALAAALHDVGELYRVRGDLAAAESYFWRALPAWASSVGAMDPHMAITLSSLALVFEARKEYAKAVPLVEQALKVREVAFGVEHPQVVPSLEQYAGLLRLLNRHEETERIEARLASISGS